MSLMAGQFRQFNLYTISIINGCGNDLNLRSGCKMNVSEGHGYTVGTGLVDGAGTYRCCDPLREDLKYV